MTKSTAIGYVRVSRVGGRVGDSLLSLELQRQSIERVCQREGLTLVDVLEELDKSGGDANRPFWNHAIEHSFERKRDPRRRLKAEHAGRATAASVGATALAATGRIGL